MGKMSGNGIRNRKRGYVPREKGAARDYVLASSDRSNQLFSDYYKKLGIIDEGEWEAFMECLRTDLPSSFRICGCRKEAEKLVTILRDRYSAKMMYTEGLDGMIPQSLPWYPLGFQTSLTRSAIRSLPALRSFHKFLISEVESGYLSRQEAVSMIPPLLLDVKPHHKVLDVCAAPGSKTMQIIEMMNTTETSLPPDGLIVANDVDSSRCYVLVSQVLKRMPVANCVVINGNAALLPDFTLSEDSSENLLFDRVLCDVVCSGDGTFRKNFDLWGSWKPQNAMGLHKLQRNIARRSAELLAVNGIMVYSTCSLNPLEDEAVVADLLRFGDGALELIDASDELPELKRSHGFSHWKVLNVDLSEVMCIDEISNSSKRLICGSMFPPSDEEKTKFNLDRCIRILPHVQNTGGFFVAVLRKMQPLNARHIPIIPPIRRNRGFKEEPFVFVSDEDNRWESISQYYGISDSFDSRNLFGRVFEAERRRTLYYVNENTRKFIQFNKKVKIINAGLRMFGRVEKKFEECPFRLSQLAAKTIFPYLRKRILEVDVDDICTLLSSSQTSVNRELLHCHDKLGNFSVGSLVLWCIKDECKFVICSWLGLKTLAPYVDKEHCIHVLRMLDYDTADLEARVYAGKNKSEAIGKSSISETEMLISLSSHDLAVETVAVEVEEAKTRLTVKTLLKGNCSEIEKERSTAMFNRSTQ